MIRILLCFIFLLSTCSTIQAFPEREIYNQSSEYIAVAWPDLVAYNVGGETLYITIWRVGVLSPWHKSDDLDILNTVYTVVTPSSGTPSYATFGTWKEISADEWTVYSENCIETLGYVYNYDSYFPPFIPLQGDITSATNANPHPATGVTSTLYSDLSNYLIDSDPITQPICPPEEPPEED